MAMFSVRQDVDHAHAIAFPELHILPVFVDYRYSGGLPNPASVHFGLSHIDIERKIHCNTREILFGTTRRIVPKLLFTAIAVFAETQYSVLKRD
jgi:phage tail tube protein FII